MSKGIGLVVKSAHGVYIPQCFAEMYDFHQWGVTEEDRNLLLKGPEEEHYWEVWDDVLNEAKFIDSDGSEWTLYNGESGDIFMVCRKLMTPREQIDCFGEYDPPENVDVYMIAEAFACYIEYGDEGAGDLTETEIAQIEEFLNELNEPGKKYIVSIESALTEEFSRCDITGLHAKCIGLLRTELK